MENKQVLSDENLVDKLVSKGFWLYFFTILIAPSGYIIRIILSNQFEPGDVGLYYSIISFIILLSAYNDLGLTQSLHYFLPRYWIKKKYNYFVTAIFSTWFLQLITGILISSALYFGLSDWLAVNHFHNADAAQLLNIMLIYFLGINVYQVIQAVTVSFQDTFQQKFAEFARMCGTLGFTVIMFALGVSDIEYYAIAWIGGLLLGILISVIMFNSKYRWVLSKGKISYSKSEVKRYLKYSLWTFLAMNSGSLLGQIDQQMVVNMMGTVQAGYFTNYESLYQTYTVLFGPILGFLLPLVSELHVKGKDDKMHLLQKYMFTYLSLFALAFGAFLGTFGLEISTTLLGNKFAMSGKLLYLGGRFVFTNVIVSICFAFLAGIGKMKQRVIVLLTAVLINLLLNYLFIPIWGLYGVIISTIIGQFFMLGMSLYYLRNSVELSFEKDIVYKNLIYIFLITFIFYNVNLYLTIDGRLNTLLYLIVAGIVFFGSLGLFNFKHLKNLLSAFKYSR